MKLPPPRTLVGVTAFVGYLGLAAAVHNLYPISTFEMYAGAPPSRAPTRVIARDASGEAHEVDEFVGWRCEGPVPLDRASCVGEWPYATTDYLDRAAADWVAGHPGPAAGGGEPVEIVRRIYRLADGGGPPAVRDCLLRRCQAGRR
jgi:hypothetical protein